MNFYLRISIISLGKMRNLYLDLSVACELKFLIEGVLTVTLAIYITMCKLRKREILTMPLSLGDQGHAI